MYLIFPKIPGLETTHQIVLCHIQNTRKAEVLPLSSDVVGIIYSPNLLG